MIANLFKTNCVCLFLNKNKLNIANAEIPAKKTTYKMESLKKTTVSLLSVHNEKKKGSTAVIIMLPIKNRL